VRTPRWTRGGVIPPDQYEGGQGHLETWSAPPEVGHAVLRARAAGPAAEFYARMAAWPGAFDDAMAEVCRRYFPGPIGSRSTHTAHSTGGPFVHHSCSSGSRTLGRGCWGWKSSPFRARIYAPGCWTCPGTPPFTRSDDPKPGATSPSTPGSEGRGPEGRLEAALADGRRLRGPGERTKQPAAVQGRVPDHLRLRRASLPRAPRGDG